MIKLIEPQPQEQRNYPDQDYYRPFTNVSRRDVMQESLEVPMVVRMLKLPCNERVLEVGCGPGFVLIPLAKLCKQARLVGIDIDKEFLEEAQKRLMTKHVSAELYQEDVRYLPFPDESFDIVVDFGTCYYVRHPLKAIKEIARILTVGGVFVYETPLNQLLSHPVRSFRRKIPWRKVPNLVPHRKAVLWASRVKR